MTTNNKQITVGLLWHSLSSDNLGVGALTESQIAICNAAAKEQMLTSGLLFLVLRVAAAISRKE